MLIKPRDPDCSAPSINWTAVAGYVRPLAMKRQISGAVTKVAARPLRSKSTQDPARGIAWLGTVVGLW